MCFQAVMVPGRVHIFAFVSWHQLPSFHENHTMQGEHLGS